MKVWDLKAKNYTAASYAKIMFDMYALMLLGTYKVSFLFSFRPQEPSNTSSYLESVMAELHYKFQPTLNTAASSWCSTSKNGEHIFEHNVNY